MSSSNLNHSLHFNNTYFQDLSELGQLVTPAVYKDAAWLMTSPELLKTMACDADLFSTNALRWFSGQTTLDHAKPFAQKYTGHQFGHYNPELGDGRGVLLGEIETQTGRWDLHVKGAGQTPYSRFGDGRAVLRSCVREFLASEALHHLGIPTSRALGVFTTGEQVQRETREPGAALIRVCPSHLRFGHFEMAFHHGDLDFQTRLVKYCLYKVLPQDHPDLEELHALNVDANFDATSDATSDANSDAKHGEKATLKTETQIMFRFIIRRTAEMVAKWQAVGFCHGVMNTDNMSVLGLTFDYGPFGFLDHYNPQHICNHSDHSGRYAFDEQPGIALWNLNVLGHSLSGIIDADTIRGELQDYEKHLLANYSDLMRNKMGLATPQKNDRILLGELLEVMQENKADYTIVWRTLSEIVDFSDEKSCARFTDLFLNREQARAWLDQYIQRLSAETRSNEARSLAMCAANPKYILRNYLAQEAIAETELNFKSGSLKMDVSESSSAPSNKKLHQLFEVLKRPFDAQPEHETLAKHPPAWSEDISISCSS